jgi:hypothetical protein
MTNILNNKAISIFVLFSLITAHLNAQTITGKVIDSSSGESLEYVSIGVVNTSLGIITDREGNFKMDVKGQSPKAIVRISMISYAPQTFTIEELAAKENIIKLTSTPVQLSDVIVRPSGKSREVGTKNYTRKGSWCGWGGSNFGQGNEIGTKIELGNKPVQIKSLHIHVHRQAFDSSLFRLHIRTIADNAPFEELLNTNIILAITKETGWFDFDLSKYNIILKGDVAVTLEWVKVTGVNKNRVQNINNKTVTEYVLFNTKKKQGNMYTRWGTEAKWVMHENGSPSIYLTIQ